MTHKAKGKQDCGDGHSEAQENAGTHWRDRVRTRDAPSSGRLLQLPGMLDDAAIEANVRDQLATLALEHEVIPCDPALADTNNFCAAYGYAPEDSANTILVVGKSDPPRYAACVVLSNTRLDVNRVVRQRFGTRKASFASAEDTRSLTGMLIGGVTVFGLPSDVPIWVDARVMSRQRIVLGGGSRSCKVVAPPAILLALPNVEVVEGLAGEPPSV
jgi:prolyl-tRNA editing enzyme YbaK/EbsC (Cys-tRNA(Pro) deacylase)